jgi:large repetitive protein
MKKLVLQLLICAILLSTIPCYAQGIGISNGATWLSSSQNADGSWGAQPDLSVVNTADAVNALFISSGVGSNSTLGITWLTSQNVTSTDELSRTIIALITAGTNSTALVTSLLSYRNGDGGWGYDLGNTSNPLDTALALKAFKAANYSDTSLIGQSLNYLTRNQNPDGGWGFRAANGALPADASNTYVTAIVLRALSAYNNVFINQDSINKAATYLLSKQNQDTVGRGFGSSPSTVYETALSFMALVEAGQGTTTALLDAIAYLSATQSANGSWNDDPYYTALALQALAAARPNLSISSISLSIPMPQDGETITITANVSNTGLDNASNVVVRFFLGDPAAGGTQIGTDQVIQLIALGSSAQASISQSFFGTGGKTIFVTVDPDNLIAETSEADNKSSARVWVSTGPDLAVYSEDLKPSTYVPAGGTAFTLNYTIRNLGESSTNSFDVALYDGQPSGTPLQTTHISGLSGSDVRTGAFGVTLTGNGNHTLYLVVDSGNAVTEISKTNNIGTVTINVGGTLTQADLAISSPDIIITPSRPHAGETIQISANVRNIGADAANNFVVEFFDGQPESGGVLLSSQALSLIAGESRAISASWTIPAGIHDIVVILDRTNQIPEMNENNNRASVRIMTDMVDISISATDLAFTPAHPVSGDSVVLSITAHNTGIKDTGPFNLALYDGDPVAGGVLKQTYPISNITGDGKTTFSYTFTAIPWTYRFYAIADTENVVTEMYEENNQAIRSLKIKAPGEVLGPDLVPTKIDLTDTATNPQSLAISGFAHVSFQNKGDDKITTSFNVTVFEDMDNDSIYTPGIDTFLGTSTFVTGPTASIPTIWPEGAGMIDVPLSGTVKFLHSPLYALVDSGDAILEQNEVNNLLISCKDCEVRPANPIQPVLKWQKTGLKILRPPVIAPLADTNGDGKVNDKDIPAIVVTQYNGFDYIKDTMMNGTLSAWRGNNGGNLFSIYDTDRAIYMNGSPVAAGDIDADGFPEVLVQSNCALSGRVCSIVAYDHNGNRKWDNDASVRAWIAAHPGGYVAGPMSNSSPPVIADLDHSGKPEIIVGTTVINSTDGSIRWARDSHTINGLYSTVADLDLDGTPEVVNGGRAYKADGTLKWSFTSEGLAAGLTAIGKFGDDPYPEIVLVTLLPNTPAVYLLDHNGNIKWGPVLMRNLDPSDPYIGLNFLHQPIIADIDGDGEMEIGVRGESRFFVLDKNGMLKRTITLHNDYPDYSTATVYDLNGDGKPELLIYANQWFRIFDGQSGRLLYSESISSGGMDAEPNVVVADVDGDGQAEIVVVSFEGIKVYRSGSGQWVSARKIWNQNDYHVTNVNDDGSIPQYESPSWLLNNTFRTQARVDQYPNPYLTPNLTASYLRAEQAGTSMNLAVRVGNGGAVASAPTVTVTYFDGNPNSGGIVIGTASTTKALSPGEFQDVVFSWPGGNLGLHHLYAVVDAANAVSECRKDDNQVAADVAIVVEYPDLKIGPENIALPAGPSYEGIPIPVTASVSNIGGLAASNVMVRLYNGNPASGGFQVGADQVVPMINAGGSSVVTFSYDTLGKAGTNVLYVVVDPSNAIAESSKANNSASLMLVVQQAVLPDLSVSAADIQLSPAAPREGDPATVTATIHNLGTTIGNIPVSFYLGNPAAGGTLIASRTIYPAMALGTTATVQASMDTTGWPGQQQVYVVLDPQNAITESRKDNNSASQSFFVQAAGLNVSMATDQTAYQADAVLTALITAADITGSARILSLGLSVQDSAGNRIATISTADPVATGPNNSITLSRTWNTGTSLAGQYTIIAELSESGRVISRKSAAFSITSDIRMNAAVTTDKISYDPHDTTALTAVVTSQSRNTIFGGLTAALTIGSNTVTSPSTTLFTDTKAITTLMPGATFTFKGYWNTGTYAPGTYPITLEVKDAGGTVVATGTQNLVISSVVKPSAVLKGQVSVDKQSILSGEPVSATYTVLNAGNVELTQVALTVRTVHVKNQTVYGILTETTGLAMATSVTTTRQIDTTSYAAMDYLVVLQASINGGLEETIAGSYFRVEGAPTVPSLSSPANGSDVQTLLPVLSVNNASDPNDDKLIYEFELYSDCDLTTLIVSAGGIAQGTGTTSWQVPAELIENSTYCWRSRAYDGKLYGDWMQAATFRVNVANDPPTVPTIASPADNTEVSVLMPVLTVNNASDPDSTSLTYNFQVALDPDFVSIVTSTTGVFSGQTPSTGSVQGITSWQVPGGLTENTWYYWRAQADDWLDTGPWSLTAKYFVNTTNDPPSKPGILSPANDAVIPGLNADIVLQNSTDIDSPIISYYFEVDTEPTFNSASIIRSGVIPAGPGTTTWQAIGLLDNTQYYVRAMASDGSAGSGWTEPAIKFFVNTANDAPTTPVIANPSNGAGVSTYTPTLTVHDATDLDRDTLTYEFEVYSDAGLTNRVSSAAGIAETPSTTSWTVPVALTENQTYYWRSRAFDGKLNSGWAEAWFMVNTANDAPGAPTIITPLDGGSVETATPTLKVQNALDPDSDHLTYKFALYNGTTLVWSTTGVPEGAGGNTSVTIPTALSNNTVYQWQCMANDGDRDGPWTAKATFTVHLPQTGITVDIEIEPETLNKKSHGNWVMVEIELPHGYKASDVDISSIRLEGIVPAMAWPHEINKHHHEHGCEHDHARHDHSELKVKFRRSDVIAVLPAGDHVPVHVTGTVAGTPFEGVDIIRVLP